MLSGIISNYSTRLWFKKEVIPNIFCYVSKMWWPQHYSVVSCVMKLCLLRFTWQTWSFFKAQVKGPKLWTSFCVLSWVFRCRLKIGVKNAKNVVDSVGKLMFNTLEGGGQGSFFSCRPQIKSPSQGWQHCLRNVKILHGREDMIVPYYPG